MIMTEPCCINYLNVLSSLVLHLDHSSSTVSNVIITSLSTYFPYVPWSRRPRSLVGHITSGPDVAAQQFKIPPSLTEK